MSTLQGAWGYGVIAATDWSGSNEPRLVEEVRVNGLGSKFDLQLLSQCGSTYTVLADPSLRCNSMFMGRYRLVGLVVKRPPRERKIPGSNPACAGIFSGSSHTSDLKIGTPLATLLGAWRYRVSAGTGRPGVSIL